MNSATNQGGAFYYLGNIATTRLEHVTVFSNSAPWKDISMNGSAKVSISNSIIWNTTVNTIAGTAYITYSDVKADIPVPETLMPIRN